MIEDAPSDTGKALFLLTDCASSPDHVFVDVASAEAMSDAFSKIGGRVKALRRTH